MENLIAHVDAVDNNNAVRPMEDISMFHKRQLRPTTSVYTTKGGFPTDLWIDFCVTIIYCPHSYKRVHKRWFNLGLGCIRNKTACLVWPTTHTHFRGNANTMSFGEQQLWYRCTYSIHVSSRLSRYRTRNVRCLLKRRVAWHSNSEQPAYHCYLFPWLVNGGYCSGLLDCMSKGPHTGMFGLTICYMLWPCQVLT